MRTALHFFYNKYNRFFRIFQIFMSLNFSNPEVSVSFGSEDEVAHEDNICHNADNSRDIQRCGPSYKGFPRKCNTYRESV